MAATHLHKDLIETLIVVEGQSYDECSRYISSLFPGIKGVSARSIRRFCVESNLLSLRSWGRRLKDWQIDALMTKSITEVIPIYKLPCFT